jgi:hypothetical protein
MVLAQYGQSFVADPQLLVRSLHPVHLADNQKHRERHNEEIDDRIHKHAVRRNRRPGFFGGRKIRVSLAVQRKEQFLEINIAEQQADSGAS